MYWAALAFIGIAGIAFFVFHRRYGDVIEQHETEQREKREQRKKEKEDILTFKF